jgi:hypothetical protein
MRRIVLLTMLALIVGTGVVATAAQTGTGSQPADSEVATGEGGCASPVASPSGSPDIDAIETATPETDEVLDALATAVASPDGSPVVQGVDPCATPGVGTPAS